MRPDPSQPEIRRAPLTPAARQALTSAVLARTTGSACDRALWLIGARPDGSFDAQTTALLAGHLEHCAKCSAIERTITDTRAILATLAELEPVGQFTSDVVAMTSRRRRAAGLPVWARLGRRWEWIRGLGERASTAWQRMLARPRLSLEAAYLATVLLVVLVGNPGLIADRLGAGSTGQVADAAATSAGAGVGRQNVASQGGGSAVPAFLDRAMREVESRQESAARGWNWFAERTSQLVTSSLDWLRGLFGWTEPRTDAPTPTEPAKPPVRASQ
jgi:hypothetical protein